VLKTFGFLTVPQRLVAQHFGAVSPRGHQLVRPVNEPEFIPV